MTTSLRRRTLGATQMFTAWTDRVRSATTALIAKRSFREWAAQFPLTRPIARRRARELFDVCAGFVYSQVLLACVRLGVFEIVAENPKTLAELSQRLMMSADATARLANAAVALRLLSLRAGRRYALGPLGAALIQNDAVRSMIEHNAVLYYDLRDPVALLRSGGADTALSRYWPYSDMRNPNMSGRQSAASYSDLMSKSQPLVAKEILDAYQLSNHSCLLDVGGGNGEFIAVVADRAPQLKLQLFDLPPVATLAETRLSVLRQQGRVEIFGGSFLHDSLPVGADVASLVRVLHDHNDESVRRILAAVRRVLPPNGVVLVAEPMAETSGAESIDAYFGFYLFAMGKGRTRTPAELTSLLAEAGFDRPRLIATHVPLQTRLLIARAS